jgi:hypothetical protein
MLREISKFSPEAIDYLEICGMIKLYDYAPAARE